uniref:D-aspartate oxidase n=1 Tax=Astyanax mexicanus TaxID=7994 RepID=A0A8B9LUF0_ASTMX
VKVAVVGAGVIGLSTAVCIAEGLPFSSVTILSEKFSPDTTGDGAAGILIPEQRWFRDTFDHLRGIIETPEAPEAGVFFSSGCLLYKEVPSDPNPYWANHVFGYRAMSDREMRRFPNHKFGQNFLSFRHYYIFGHSLPIFYIDWVVECCQFGFSKKVTDLQQLVNSYDVIVNCSGLGSRLLVGDEGVYPVRGQILKVHAPWVKNFIGGGDGGGRAYIYPGIDYITVGGTRQVDDWRLEVDMKDTEGIMERCCQLEPSLRKAQVLEEWVGLRPGRRNPRVESEWLQAGQRRVILVHNHGHDGCGGAGEEDVAMSKTQIKL